VFNLIAQKLFWAGLHRLLTDRQYARFRYRFETGRPLNLDSPKAFTEKIQYLKLYNRNELRRRVANRLTAREYVAEKAGSEYLIPLHLVTQTFTERDWDALPDQFVLKANHGCGMVELVTDKNSHNFDDLRETTRKWQGYDYASFGREWVYRGVPRTIIAEELLLNRHDEIPKDYKFFCFHGKVEMIKVNIGQFENQRRNLYDRNFNLLEAEGLYPNQTRDLKKPKNLAKMIDVAETLSEEFNFIRVDLYSIDEKIYFGELTNFPGNGFIPFRPDSFDFELGKRLHLETD
jgi:hypothetical protein